MSPRDDDRPRVQNTREGPLNRLFPGWSGVGSILVIVGFRFLANVGLTALVVDATGQGSVATVAMALTLGSSALMVLVLRRTVPGRFSVLEVALQLGFIVLTAVVVALHPSLGRVGGVVFVSVGALIGLFFAIVTYGELGAP